MQSWFITQQISQTIYTSGLDEAIIYTSAVAKSQAFFDRIDWLILFYSLGVLYMSVLFCINLFKAQQFVSSKNSNGLASSFFGKISIDKKLPHQDVIFSHELAHGKQVHSFDLMMISIVKIICWFNPIVYLLHIEFKKIHEFIADSEAAIHLGSRKAYAEILVSNQFRTNANSLVHNFYEKATVKTRLIMLSKKKSPNKAILKYGLIAPAGISMLILASSFVPSSASRLAEVHSQPFSFSKLFDQEINISGEVKDNEGLPLPGANIKVKGSSRKTTTDTNGKFTINEVKEGSILLISFVGFDPIEVVATKSYLESILYPSSFKIGEVVITALGTSTTKSNPTSSSDLLIEENPEFPGGTKELYRFISTNLRYPAMAQKNNVKGKVIVNFTIDKQGNAINPVILQGIGSGCDEEVIRIVNIMPKWQAAKQNGQKVATTFEVPVKFENDQVSAMPNTIQQRKGEEVFTAVEVQPEFPGGISAMFKYIGKNLAYPEAALENNIEGRVFVKFIVSKTGEINDIEVLKGIGYGCDEAAKQVLRNMPKWKSGFQNGRAVNVYFTMPILFELNKKGKPSKNTQKQNLEIENANILDRKAARTKYGNQAENGAMVMELNDKQGLDNKKNVLFAIDSKIVSKAAFESIDVSKIISITVLKNAEAIKKYPTAGEKDVAEIVLKKE